MTIETATKQDAGAAVVLGMLEAWKRLDLDAVMAFIAQDAVFLPDPGGDAVRGHDAIRTLWSRYMGLFAAYSFEIVNMLSTDRLVFMERVEQISRVDGQQIVIPVAAVFEIDAAGKLTGWRDYWDPAVMAPAA